MTQIPNDPTAVLMAQLMVSADDSKKYQMMSRALYASLGVFAVTMFAIILQPTISDTAFKLAVSVLGVIGLTTGVYTGAQAASDIKNIEALSTANDSAASRQ